MHEYGIAQQIVSLALAYAQTNAAARVTQLTIGMSQTADESEDSLVLYLGQLTQGTIAQGANFEIQRVGAMVTCPTCGCEFELVLAQEPCPRCYAVCTATQNEEFRLTSIQIE